MSSRSQPATAAVAPHGQFCYNDDAYSLVGGAMVKFTSTLPIIVMLAVAAGLAAASPAQAAQRAHGDSLLIHRVQQENQMNLPRRGLSMAQVEKSWGAPLRKLAPRGGDTPKHPVINRWDYAHFIVYFERNHVIHSVLNTPAGNNTNPSSTN